MTDFHEAIHDAVEVAREVAGVGVQYLRRDGGLLSVSAIIGTTKFERHTASGVVVMAPVRDFLIAADALSIDPLAEPEDLELFDPEPGDRIAQVQGGTRYVYQVMPLDGTKESEWLDTATNEYRIHTRLVKRLPAGDAWP